MLPSLIGDPPIHEPSSATRGVTFRGDPRVSVGVGLTALGGFLRVHVARPLVSGAPWRFDLVFGPLR